MHFDILTLFPELITSYLESSIMGRAQNADVYSYKTHDISDYAVDKYGRVDDTLYGGGVGMLMMADPIFQAWNHAKALHLTSTDKRKTIFLSPKGRVFNQALAKELTTYDHILLLCGHYEGVDQRVLDEMCVDEISLGDFVISGGELGAMAIIDTVVRMLPGTFTDQEAFQEDSHYHGVLEGRQYTKPRVWMGREVPEVLLSGNHKRIEEYRRLDSLNETLIKRPDLFNKLHLAESEMERLLNFRNDLLHNIEK